MAFEWGDVDVEVASTSTSTSTLMSTSRPWSRQRRRCGRGRVEVDVDVDVDIDVTPLNATPQKSERRAAALAPSGATLSFYNSALKLRITAIGSFRWPYTGPFKAAF